MKRGAKAGRVAKKGAAKKAVKPAVKKGGVAKAVVSPPPNEKPADKDISFPIIGIGASAGGLEAEDTLMKAKILAVADVVEAMASHRPYRPALGIDKALEEISNGRGKLYDPGVVDTCLDLFTEKGFKFKK